MAEKRITRTLHLDKVKVKYLNLMTEEVGIDIMYMQACKDLRANTKEVESRYRAYDDDKHLIEVMDVESFDMLVTIPERAFIIAAIPYTTGEDNVILKNVR